MVNFLQRSYEKELLDKDHIPTPDLYRNLKELDIINRILGGHAVTLKGLSSLLLDRNKTYRVLDIGCGGGDTLKAVAKWAKNKGYTFVLTGVDLKPECIEYATSFCREFPEIRFIQSDYRDLPSMNEDFDIVITSLFCHHLNDNELSDLFAWCADKSRRAFVMNDLHRHPFAYYSIAILTSMFSRSYLVKNDAKLSVLRGFKRHDLEYLLGEAGIAAYSLNWRWAFRWMLIIQKTGAYA